MILRGSRDAGYRTDKPCTCPSCGASFHMSARADQDKQGPFLIFWATRSEPLDRERVFREAGVALPQKPPRTRMKDDPLPTFERERP